MEETVLQSDQAFPWLPVDSCVQLQNVFDVFVSKTHPFCAFCLCGEVWMCVKVKVFGGGWRIVEVCRVVCEFEWWEECEICVDV